ncbi:MAG TPA: hypothetical protein PLO85_05965 [Candidatus Omnitrophota bacterium]|nr:hypothetical protein [Candidatus Omnitrophota bacterium]
MILHIDMDAFFASIEQAINPRLKGKPLIVGSRGSKMHTVVCASSYEAKAYGIKAGTPSSEAFRICPNLQFVTADQSKYIWTSEQIFAMLKDYGFVLNYASIDEFQLDINDHPDPQNLAQTIQRQITEKFNITASIGIAKNWLLAKLGSKLNKPNGIAMITDQNVREILGKTPVEKLTGVGQKTAIQMHARGIQTCLDLYDKTPGFLERSFGKNGLGFYTSLHATEHLESESEDSKPKSIGHSYTLPGTSQNPRFIKAWIRLLSDMVAFRLRKKNLAAGSVHVWLSGPIIGNFSSQQSFSQITDDGYEIYLKSLKIAAKTGPRMPEIRAIGVTCSNLEERLYKPLFEEIKRREDLLKTIDTINGRYGDDTIYPAVITLTKEMTY